MPIDELLNVYDASGAIVGARPRNATQRPGHAAGAVQLLLVGGDGRVLLQQRRADKENGGLWDKSVGGHVLAGESFDQALLREANEELFGAQDADRVTLASSMESLSRAAVSDPTRVFVFPARTELNLRDIRFLSAARKDVINVTYHAAMYLGATRLSRADFAPQADELIDLRWFSPREVDRMLTHGDLAPNMGFLWFALGHAAVALMSRV